MLGNQIQINPFIGTSYPGGGGFQPMACRACSPYFGGGVGLGGLQLQMAMLTQQMMSLMSALMSFMAGGNGTLPTQLGSANFGNPGSGVTPGVGNFLGGHASAPASTPASTGAATPVTPTATPTASSPTGSFPAPPSGPISPTSNLQDTNGAKPINAPTTNNAGNRSVNAYNSVIDQFDVERNPRYAQRNGNTYCNIFVSDVTRAMGAEIPHWWNGREMDANATCDWLKNNGGQYGWKPVTAQEAQAIANEGKPVVATWKNQGGIGHVGIVRPGEIKNGPALAQAGSKNVNKAHVKDTFGNAEVVYYAHP